jgi:Pyruvate/2-oxoacid:ferredoxin oxidoreductase gamma subunit
VNAEQRPPELEGEVLCVPASRLAVERGSGFVNVTMLGAVGAALGEPPLEAIQDAAVSVLGSKVEERAVREAVEEGYRCLR